MSYTAFIPARKGSKGIPGKNIKLFCGQPLIYWNLKAIEDCRSIDKVVVATDGDEIEGIVQSFGFSKTEIYIRSENSANDSAPTEQVMLEYLDKAQLSDEDKFVLVQATSPFTQANDFDAAIRKFETEGFDSILSCARMKRFVWDDNGQPINYNFKARPRRQDFNGLLMENGAFYINSVGNILSSKNRLSGKIGIYEMPEYTSLELDESSDWIIGEALMRKNVLRRSDAKKRVKLFLSDVDGVLTDAGMYYTENGDEIKKFSTYDGMAFAILKKLGVLTGIITSEDRMLNKRRAEKLQLDFIHQGAKNKIALVEDICEKLNITLEEVAYIGDDINDLIVLERVGMPACPANARKEIKQIPGIVNVGVKGGEGAVRAFLEWLEQHDYLPQPNKNN
ncbi:MAG: HAD family hydrolase [Bacteroidota bacterium]